MSDRVRIAFYKAPGERYDQLIRLWTRSLYTHVELVLGEEGEHLCYSSSPREGGIRCKAIDLKPDHWEILELPWVDADTVRAHFADVTGMPYDWKGIFLRQFLNVPVWSKERWFCSAICAHALGLPDATQYSPGELYSLLSAGWRRDLSLINR